MQTRVIHFFSRRTAPLLPCDTRTHPGNVTDVLLAIHCRYKRHNFETGYDGTFYTNSSIRSPRAKINGDSLVRDGFYGTYLYILKSLPAAVGGGVSGSYFQGGRAQSWACWLTAGMSF